MIFTKISAKKYAPVFQACYTGIQAEDPHVDSHFNFPPAGDGYVNTLKVPTQTLWNVCLILRGLPKKL